MEWIILLVGGAGLIGALKATSDFFNKFSGVKEGMSEEDVKAELVRRRAEHSQVNQDDDHNYNVEETSERNMDEDNSTSRWEDRNAIEDEEMMNRMHEEHVLREQLEQDRQFQEQQDRMFQEQTAMENSMVEEPPIQEENTDWKDPYTDVGTDMNIDMDYHGVVDDPLDMLDDGYDDPMDTFDSYDSYGYDDQY